jgi:hypothetical protein
MPRRREKFLEPDIIKCKRNSIKKRQVVQQEDEGRTVEQVGIKGSRQ